MITHEYSLGRGGTDLLIHWPLPTGSAQRVVIETKIRPGDLNKNISKGVEQTWQYLDRCGATSGHLALLDRTPGKPWQEKIFKRVHQGRTITVWGM